MGWKIVCVCNSLTYLLCLTALTSLNIAVTNYLSITKRGCTFVPHVHLEYKEVDVHIVICAPAAPRNVSERLQLQALLL